MIIEIRKTGFVNKGAELMLYAALQKMYEFFPNAKYVMAPDNKSAPYEKRAELKLYQKAWYWRYRFQWGNIARIIPNNIRSLYGIILDKEIDVVLDASGFSYSDQWGISSNLEMANSCRRWKKNGTKIILLPQAFGPFNNVHIKKSIAKIINNANLVFARDLISYNHLINNVGESSKIRIAPDFTNLVDGIIPEEFDKNHNRFCIIPNHRMIQKTNDRSSAAYLPFMIKCTKYLMEKNEKPFFLIHEGDKDLEIAEKINSALGVNIPLIQENHPLKIKGIIGVCEGTIGSRFHGLVSALSQGIPSLATGWSHKYQMLLEEYGFSEGLIDVTGSENEIEKKIDLITTSDAKNRIKANIKKRASSLKNKSEQMWSSVLEEINTS